MLVAGPNCRVGNPIVPEGAKCGYHHCFGSRQKESRMTFRADDQLPAKRHSLRQVETYEVERSHFDAIEKEATGIGTAFAFAAACLPVAVTLNVTLKTVPITDRSVADPFWFLMWACYILGLFFAVSAWRQRGSLKRFMDEIRESQVAPIAAKVSPSEPDLTAINDPEAPVRTQEASPDVEEG